MTWRATIQQTEPWGMTVRLYVYRTLADGRVDTLLPDGHVQRLEEATAPPDNAGLIIPQEALGAIAEAFHPYAGHKVEVRRLEETLSLERNRVDLIIERALEH